MNSLGGWTRDRVVDVIVHHASGPSPTCDERNIATQEEWGLLKTTAVVWDGWNPTAHKVPPQQFWGNSSLEVQAGDVLVTKAGPRHRCGVSVYVLDTPPRLMASGKMILLRPNKEKVNAVVLASALATDKCQRFLDSRTTGMADAQLNFTNELLLGTEIAIPPLPEQRKIARILTTLDELIGKTQALIAKYQAIKQGMMHDLFTRGVDEHGQLRSTHDEAPELYKESELGWIPKEWNVYRLEDLTTRIVDGVHHTPEYVEYGVPFVTVKNLTSSDGIDLLDVNYVREEDHRAFQLRANPSAGDVLVTKDGTLGVARIVPSGLPEFSIFVSVAMLRPNDSLCTAELIWLFFDSGAYETQLGRRSAGTGLRHIHLEHFREFRVATPPLEEQESVFRRLQDFATRLQNEQTYLKQLRETKTGLIQDLLTGKVRVKPDEAGGPP